MIKYIRQWYRRWQERRRLKREARRIATVIGPKLWEDVRRKLVKIQQAEFKKYADVRAAQLAQPHVDELLKANPKLTGMFGSLLLLVATKKAVQRALAIAAKAH